MAQLSSVDPATVCGRDGLSRRRFLRAAATLGLSAAGMALLDGCAGRPSAPGVSQETLETTTIRLSPAICAAPLYIAEEILKGEGFTKVQYVTLPDVNLLEALTTGQVDMGVDFSERIITFLDAGKPLAVLAGMHVGCIVLFGTERVNSVSDLKGKTVTVPKLGDAQHIFLSSMLAYVGLNPATDITWITLPWQEAQRRFTEGKIDAILALPPIVQELQAKKLGHVVFNSGIDKPWSQYYCCMMTARQEFVQQNPVATKRALRAILKATDIVAREPELAAKLIVNRGFTKNYGYALQATRDLSYNRWREYDPVDTLRFFALRLRDAGMIKLSPDEIIAKGADWRFLNELKKELPAAAARATTSELFCRLGEPG